MSEPLPELSDALRELWRRQVRAIVWLVVRIMAMAALSASLVISVPWLRTNRWILDAVSGVLVLWPLWGTVGRNWAWRIALGRAYYNAGRYADAETVLKPLSGIQGALFDATGEGQKTLDALREAKK